MFAAIGLAKGDKHTFENIVFHIDVNSAFLSWEAVYRLFHRRGTLDLREIPSAVGGDVSLRHGIILAKSIPAKDYGIKTGKSIPKARRKCPNLVLVPRQITTCMNSAPGCSKAALGKEGG